MSLRGILFCELRTRTTRTEDGQLLCVARADCRTPTEAVRACTIITGLESRRGGKEKRKNGRPAGRSEEEVEELKIYGGTEKKTRARANHKSLSRGSSWIKPYRWWRSGNARLDAKRYIRWRASAHVCVRSALIGSDYRANSVLEISSLKTDPLAKNMTMSNILFGSCYVCPS